MKAPDIPHDEHIRLAPLRSPGTYGHAEGVRALAAFAERLKTASRDADFFVRLGGDDFVRVPINAFGENAESVVSRFHHSVEKYNQEAKRGYRILFSYGIERRSQQQ